MFILQMSSCIDLQPTPTIACIFEAVVFLTENKDYWDLKLIQEMVSGHWDEQLGKECESDDEDDMEEY